MLSLSPLPLFLLFPSYWCYHYILLFYIHKYLTGSFKLHIDARYLFGNWPWYTKYSIILTKKLSKNKITRRIQKETDLQSISPSFKDSQKSLETKRIPKFDSIQYFANNCFLEFVKRWSWGSWAWKNVCDECLIQKVKIKWRKRIWNWSNESGKEEEFFFKYRKEYASLVII